MGFREIQALGGEGILRESDLEDFSAAEKRVYYLLMDGEWYGGEDIRMVAGANGMPASEGLRRYRSVRAALEPKGYTFDRKRASDGRNFVYRMTPPSKDTLF